MAMTSIPKSEGYDALSLEEKLAYYEAFQYDDKASELEKAKNAVTKANGEAAEYKRRYQEKLTAEEKAKEEENEQLVTLQNRVKELEAREAKAVYKSQFLALGYDDELASDTAEAMFNGDTAKVFANQKVYLEKHNKAYKAQLMGNGATPQGGNNGGSDVMTLEAFRKLGAAERLAFAQQHPEEYKNLYGGTN